MKEIKFHWKKNKRFKPFEYYFEWHLLSSPRVV